MLCYANVMLCYDMLSYVIYVIYMLCDVIMLCSFMLCCVLLCDVKLCYVM